MRKTIMLRLALAVVCALLMPTVPAVLGADEPNHSKPFAESLDNVLISAASAASPSVVAIEVKRSTTPHPPSTPPTRPQPVFFVRGTGPVTGVILSADGYIVTSFFNVSGDIESIKVTLPDGSSKDAKLLGIDRSRSIALLKVEAQGLPVPRMIRVNDIHVGEWVLALGRTFPGQTANVSLGIVSATNRMAGRAIQTDADVGPGNYGGALVDVEGRLIGILTPISGGGPVEAAVQALRDSGIGFAIPVADILAEMDRLKAGETIRPSYLGISFNPTMMKGGAVVKEILPDTGAAKSGLKTGDVIIEFDGKPINAHFQLLHAIGSRAAGDVVNFKVKRGAETLDFTVTLGERPDDK